MKWERIPELWDSYQEFGIEGKNLHILLMVPPGYSRMALCSQSIEYVETISFVTEAALVGTFRQDGESIPGLLTKKAIYCTEMPRMSNQLLDGLLRGKIDYKTATSKIMYDIQATLWCYSTPRELSELERQVFTVVDMTKYLSKELLNVLDTGTINVYGDGEYNLEDSGDRTEYESGAHRDRRSGKGRFDLVPWEVIHDLAIHFEKGAIKYGEGNWTKGIPLDDYFDSAIRHQVAHKLGRRNENHLIAAIWNLVCQYQTELWIKRGELPESLREKKDV